MGQKLGMQQRQQTLKKVRLTLYAGHYSQAYSIDAQSH